MDNLFRDAYNHYFMNDKMFTWQAMGSIFLLLFLCQHWYLLLVFITAFLAGKLLYSILVKKNQPSQEIE